MNRPRILLATAFFGAITCLGLIACDSGTSKGSPQQIAQLVSTGFPNSSSLGGGINSVGSFTAVSAMSQGARAGHTATVLPNGQVLVVGGQNAAGPAAASMQQEAELYDPTADTWTVVSTVSPSVNEGRLMDPTGLFPTGRIYHVAVSVPAGVVTIAGGLGFQRLQNNMPVVEPLDTAYVYNPSTRTFARVSAMPTPRYFHLGALTGNGGVMVACGWDVFNAAPKFALQSADTLDPGTGNWAAVPGGANAISAGHTWGNITRIGQNNTLVMNGGLFDNAASMMPPPTPIAINAISPQAVMIGSPNSTGRFSSGGEIFTPTNPQFIAGPSSVRLTPPRGVMLAAGVTLNTNVIVFAGGEDLGPAQDTRFVNLSSTELLDVATQQFVAGPAMNSSAPPPQGQTAPTPIAVTQLEALEIGASADVLLMGGVVVDAQGMPMATPQCEILDTINVTMKNVLAMQTGRFDFRAVKLTGNQILVIGGRTDPAMNTPTDSVELYNR